MAILEVSSLCKSFGGLEAVAGLSFEVAEGELVALIGPNGAGKTTCFNLLGGQLAPDRGSIRFRGRSIVGLPPRRIWRLGIGRTFQVTAIFSSMSVMENVQMALISHHRRTRALVPPAKRLYRDEARALLTLVGMVEQTERPCGLLAYGDLKRVELAIALANDPKVLLMDEPTAGMAPNERVTLMALVVDIVRHRRLAALFTEHDMDVVFAYADRVMVLHRGSLLASGSPAKVRGNREVQEVYLGRSWGKTSESCSV